MKAFADCPRDIRIRGIYVSGYYDCRPLNMSQVVSFTMNTTAYILFKHSHQTLNDVLHHHTVTVVVRPPSRTELISIRIILYFKEKVIKKYFDLLTPIHPSMHLQVVITIEPAKLGSHSSACAVELLGCFGLKRFDI